MKKQLLTLTLAIFSFGIHAQVPNYVPTNGLVGWWPFNGNANDESGNGNNGVVNGAVLVNDRNANVNSAYSFSNSSITCSNNNIPTDIFSLSVWVLQNQTFGDIEYVCLGSPASTRWGAIYSPLITTMNYGRGCSGSGGSTINPPVNLNIWNHIVYVPQSATQNTNIYINGVFVGSTVNNNTGSCSNNNLYFGVDIFSASEYIDGKLDDIGIWNRALSECEIQDLYNSQLNTIASSVTLNVATLTADLSGVSYEWLDCDNNNAQIVGEINQSFTPSAQTGNYSVEITMNGCVDTSSCYLVDYTGINELNSNKSKKLLKIVDFMGREISYKKNTPMIFIYEDGTVERVVEVE